MAVVHALIIKSKPSITDVSGFAAKIKAGYEKVDIVKSVRVGESINSVEQNKGYNFTLLLEFEDEATLKKYLEAPEAQAKKAQYLDPNVEEIIIIDFKY
ncbi:hypothetical protein HWV62_28523 [Athelia sp. TMB]|nr:hypothetical protein HWV62_28523 [Athelia sp. TMB]